MRSCPECGYPNDLGEHRCEKCGIRFDLLDPEYASPEEESEAPSAPPPPPVWQGEVNRRLARFRQRVVRTQQAVLPLDEPEPAPPPPARGPTKGPTKGKIIPFPAPVITPEIQSPPPRPAPPAPQPQPRLDWPERHAVPHPPPFLDFPVAPLRQRCWAATWDSLLIGAGYAVLAVAYWLSGGQLPQHKIAVAAAVVGLAFLPWFYHYLFLILCGATPGMSWEGLRLVNFDGRPASLEQRRHRAITIVFSAAPLLVGFLWAAVDEETLTWHDRISETCLTAAPLPRSRRR